MNTAPANPVATTAQPARFKAPSFSARATVGIYLPDSSSHRPDARVRVSFRLSHRDEEFLGGREAAQAVLWRLGVDQTILNAATYEVSVDEYFALEARYVRKSEGEHIQAFDQPEKKDEERLVRQRRLVPESYHEMVKLYGPKPIAAV
jgi:hypothetical protein